MKANNPNHMDNLVYWKKGQSGNPAGRKPNRILQLLKKNKVKECYGLTDEEINTTERCVLEMGIKGLQAIAKDDETPAYMKALAMACITDMKAGRTNTVNMLRDRQYGAITKQVDVTTGGVPIATQSLTPSEAKALLKKIEKEC